MMYLEIRHREKKVIRLCFKHIDNVLHYRKNQGIIKHVIISDLPIVDKSKYIFIDM